MNNDDERDYAEEAANRQLLDEARQEAEETDTADLAEEAEEQ